MAHSECCEACKAPIDPDTTLEYCWSEVLQRLRVACSPTCAAELRSAPAAADAPAHAEAP